MQFIEISKLVILIIINFIESRYEDRKIHLGIYLRKLPRDEEYQELIYTDRWKFNIPLDRGSYEVIKQDVLNSLGDCDFIEDIKDSILEKVKNLPENRDESQEPMEEIIRQIEKEYHSLLDRFLIMLQERGELFQKIVI